MRSGTSLPIPVPPGAGGRLGSGQHCKEELAHSRVVWASPSHTALKPCNGHCCEGSCAFPLSPWRSHRETKTLGLGWISRVRAPRKGTEHQLSCEAGKGLQQLPHATSL